MCYIFPTDIETPKPPSDPKNPSFNSRKSAQQPTSKQEELNPDLRASPSFSNRVHPLEGVYICIYVYMYIYVYLFIISIIYIYTENNIIQAPVFGGSHIYVLCSFVHI